jgi:hypothetical protein
MIDATLPRVGSNRGGVAAYGFGARVRLEVDLGVGPPGVA